jgi:hypothetical protein
MNAKQINTSATVSRALSRRRTKRLALTAPVEVSGEDVQGSYFRVTARASNLNRNGAALHLNRYLSTGAVLMIQNSRGARTSARIVARTSTGEGLYTYGVEFLEADSVKDFWGITFPSPSQDHPPLTK